MGPISKIKNLYGFQNGDTITPKMGAQIDAGYGIHQFWDVNTKRVTQTDFSDHPVTLFPQAWSSKKARTIVPSTQGQQWYYNNISSNAGILDENGNVKSAYQSLFEVDTVIINGSTFPALRIKDNLVDENSQDFSDKFIYYVGTYEGVQFTCEQQIPIRAAAKDAIYVMVQAVGRDGIIGDDVLGPDNDYVEYTAYLQQAGNNITGATFSFQHLENGNWVNVTTNQGVIEVNNNKLKLYDDAVEGTDLYRVDVTYNGEHYYATMTPTDEHDPYYIVDGCNISGDAVEEGQTVTFSPKVYSRNPEGEDQDVTQSEGWTFTYDLIKRSDGSIITDLTVAGLNYDTITAKGGITVRIKASRA